MNSFSISPLSSPRHDGVEHCQKGNLRHKVLTRSATICLDDRELGEMKLIGQSDEFQTPKSSVSTANVPCVEFETQQSTSGSDQDFDTDNPTSSPHEKMLTETASAKRAMFAGSSASSLCSSHYNSSQNNGISSKLNDRMRISTVSSFSSSGDSKSPSPNFSKQLSSVEKGVGDNDVFEELWSSQRKTIFNGNGAMQHMDNSNNLPHQTAGRDSNLSEKGQIARQSYQSSGYGTGSKGSEQELSTTQSSCQKSEDDTVFTDGIASEQLVHQNRVCDAKLQSRSFVSCHANDTQSDGSSQRNLDSTSTLTSSKLKSDEERHVSQKKQKDSGRLGLKTYVKHCSEPVNDKVVAAQESIPHAKQKFTQNLAEKQSLQCSSNLGPHSLTNMTSRTSGSSGGSYFITPSMEAALPSLTSPFKKMLQSIQLATGTGDFSTEFSWDLESLLHSDVQKRPILKPLVSKKPQACEETPQAQGYISEGSDYDSLNLGIDSEFLDKLFSSARCEDPYCTNGDCLQIKKGLADLQDHGRSPKDLTDFHRSLLIHMFEHAEMCHLPNCPFAWCSCEPIFTQEPESADDIIIEMKQRAENFLDESRLFDSPISKFMKMDETLDIEPVPEKWKDWQLLCMIGNANKDVLAMPHWTSQMNSQYWVVKKVLASEGDTEWELFSRLRSLQHDSINKQLWVAGQKDKDNLLICSLYEGYSLHECLQQIPPDTKSAPTDLKLIINIMMQITSAVQHLHQLDIVYLNWISKNVLISHQCDLSVRVKLCNFSSSALLDNYDSGHLSLVLPVHVLTPELLRDKEGDDLQPESDVWGLACLLHELVTARPIWHEQRHLRAEELRMKMEKNPVPSIPSTHSELEPIFAGCWKKNPKNRLSLNEIMDAFQSSNREIVFRNALVKDYRRSEA